MIDQLLTILGTIILPVFLLIGTGYLLDRRFRLDTVTLGRLNFYVFVPALIFVKILESTIRLDEAWRIVLVMTALIALLWLLTRVLFRLPVCREHAPVLTMGALFFNAGNYGIPLAELAWPDVGGGLMAVVLMVQNFVSFTLGLWLMESGKHSPLAVLSRLLRVPVVLAILSALLARLLQEQYQLTIPTPVMTPLRYLADGLIPVALLTLGVQLARTSAAGTLGPLALAGAVRLLVSPLLAWGLVRLIGLQGTAAALCIVAGGLPVAVNVYILAAEYRQDEDLASRLVFWTTLFSAFTLTLLLALLRG